MNRREMLVATGGVTATALGGCLGVGGSGATTTGGDATVEARNGRRIIVSNTGKAEGEPDLAVLDVGIEVSGDSASDVRDELAERSDDLRDALFDYGIDEDDVTTSHFRIRERMDRRRMEEDGVRPDSEDAAEYVHYEGTHAFSVEVHDVDAAGEVVDVAVDAGADRVGRITFTLSDERRAELREEALSTAIADARSEADAIAAEVDASVVEASVVDASEGQVSPIRRDLAYDDTAEAATPAPNTAATAFETGDVTVTARVRVQYRME